VFPALTLNYLGQGALILGDPSAISNPFYLLLPEWGRIPMVFLATAATVIASQALISGAFSITRQAVQLGFLPRISIRHTSSREEGQIYIPAVNWALLAGVVAIVVGFGSAAGLANAYGVAVTGTFVFTTILFLVIARHRWNAPLWALGLGGALFLGLDLLFFSSNLTKVAEGGWLPLGLGLVVFVVLTTWRRGREIVTANRIAEEGSLTEFVDELQELESPLVRVPGTGIYLNANPDTTPLAMRAAVEHHQALHRCALIVTVETTRTPHVPPAERLTVDDLGHRDDGIAHITARFGFQDVPDVPAALRGLGDEVLEAHCDVSRCSYFLSRIAIAPTDSPGMSRWRKRLFVAISRNSASPADYFHLPRERTVITGAQISI
jgi:KUP system potassium uptake protein